LKETTGKGLSFFDYLKVFVINPCFYLVICFGFGFVSPLSDQAAHILSQGIVNIHSKVSRGI
jgi:hypothetical protein